MEHITKLSEDRVKIRLIEREWLDGAITIQTLPSGQDIDHPEDFDDLALCLMHTVQERGRLVLSVYGEEIKGYPVAVAHNHKLNVHSNSSFISIDMELA
jgi:hypothetical protein